MGGRFPVWSDENSAGPYRENRAWLASLPMPFTNTADLKVLELVQLFMSRVPAPSGEFAGVAGLDLIDRKSVV